MILTLVVTLFLGLALFLFGLEYSKELGAFQEQRAAIDVASLAAAKDLSKIVVEDPYFGFIGLSDYAPGGQTQGLPPVPNPPVPPPTSTPNPAFTQAGTTAADGFPMPVRSINTILATVRVDMIVADVMQDQTMYNLAQLDYQYAMAAQANLAANLNSVISSGNASAGASVVDVNGNPPHDVNGAIVNPYADAVAAYKSNKVRMSGSQTTLLPGSLNLTLGYVPSVYTSRAPVPQPTSAAQIPATQQAYSYYLPNVAIYYKNKNAMVFSALASDTTLVDTKTFQTAFPGGSPPAAITPVPTVVLCQADQQYLGDGPSGNPTTRVIHATSAALCSCITDQRPNPGSFTITFLNGSIPEIISLGTLFNVDQIGSDPTDYLQTPLGGDYPQVALSPLVLPATLFPSGLNGGHPRFTYLLSVAFYDWVRRAGDVVNVQNLVNTLNTPLASGNAPQIHNFQMMPDGTIRYTTYPAPQQNYSVSNNQWRALSGQGFASNNGNQYDLQITNFVFQEGRMYGGKHGGEPLDSPGQLTINPNPWVVSPATAIFENSTLPYQSFLPGQNNVTRPTYQSEGVACDFTFRQH